MLLSREGTWWSLGLRRVGLKANERKQCRCAVSLTFTDLNFNLFKAVVVLFRSEFEIAFSFKGELQRVWV